MAEFYRDDIPILDPANPQFADVFRPAGMAFGAVPRDWAAEPPVLRGSQDAPGGIRVIDPSEWDARFDEQNATESSLEHIYLRGGAPAFVNLDQGRDGDCWAYSTGQAWMLTRLRDNLDHVRANPHFIAAYLRRYDGGWCGASAEVLNRVGILPEGTGPGQWPKWSHAVPSAAHIEAAGAYRSGEQWFDIARPVHGQRMATNQLATLGFNNIPAPSDFNFWAHSVCQVRWVRIERGSWGPLILNSWLGWGRHGLAVLRGSQAIADGAVAIRSA